MKTLIQLGVSVLLGGGTVLLLQSMVTNTLPMIAWSVTLSYLWFREIRRWRKE